MEEQNVNNVNEDVALENENEEMEASVVVDDNAVMNDDISNSKPEKKPSLVSVFFRNLKYRLSYTPALAYTGIFSLVCFLGFSFFVGQKSFFVNDPEVVSACTIMIAFFGLLFVLFIGLFGASIVLNIIRYRDGKR